ncbi:UTP--glucose-1-phosphate uridylyltransferase [Mycoplasma crocodyli]|uniref:UTP--glucose-1-phosphate uridylyltransferase n=1 Tax=Mycoplasma crocodyli TaxID=50052 RepID=UPI0003119668|nr:UTP--glucose-1-phosphate uridylyltransferase [Mycoplasma crocodyli]
MEKQIKKVIIPCAGWGTRFLPLTKTIHKELLPILNRPAIDYLIDEAIESGIEEVILVISERKRELDNYFKINEDLETELKTKNKTKLLQAVKKTNRSKYITIVIQDKQLGLGHAISICKNKVGNEPFGVILGDDLIRVDAGEKPALKQLIDTYDKIGHQNIVGVQKVPWDCVNKYGIVAPKIYSERKNKFFEIIGAIEKPQPEDSPSSRAILGRYIFNPEIFDLLLKTKPGVGSEIQLVDCFDELMLKQKVFACEFSGTRYDLGGVEGFVKANIDYALDNEQFSEQINEFIHSKIR